MKKINKRMIEDLIKEVFGEFDIKQCREDQDLNFDFNEKIEETFQEVLDEATEDFDFKKSTTYGLADFEELSEALEDLKEEEGEEYEIDEKDLEDLKNNIDVHFDEYSRLGGILCDLYDKLNAPHWIYKEEFNKSGNDHYEITLRYNNDDYRALEVYDKLNNDLILQDFDDEYNDDEEIINAITYYYMEELNEVERLFLKDVFKCFDSEIIEECKALSYNGLNSWEDIAFILEVEEEHKCKKIRKILKQVANEIKEEIKEELDDDYLQGVKRLVSELEELGDFEDYGFEDLKFTIGEYGYKYKRLKKLGVIDQLKILVQYK